MDAILFHAGYNVQSSGDSQHGYTIGGKSKSVCIALQAGATFLHHSFHTSVDHNYPVNNSFIRNNNLNLNTAFSPSSSLPLSNNNIRYHTLISFSPLRPQLLHSLVFHTQVTYFLHIYRKLVSQTETGDMAQEEKPEVNLTLLLASFLVISVSAIIGEGLGRRRKDLLVFAVTFLLLCMSLDMEGLSHAMSIAPMATLSGLVIDWIFVAAEDSMSGPAIMLVSSWGAVFMDTFYRISTGQYRVV